MLSFSPSTDIVPPSVCVLIIYLSANYPRDNRERESREKRKRQRARGHSPEEETLGRFLSPFFSAFILQLSNPTPPPSVLFLPSFQAGMGMGGGGGGVAFM